MTTPADQQPARMREDDLPYEHLQAFMYLGHQYPCLRPEDVAGWDEDQASTAVRFILKFNAASEDPAWGTIPAPPFFLSATVERASARNHKVDAERTAAEDAALVEAGRDLVAAMTNLVAARRAMGVAAARMTKALGPAEYRDDFGLPMVVGDRIIAREGAESRGRFRVDRIASRA